MDYTDDQLKKALDRWGSARRAAKELGIPRTTFRRHIARIEQDIFTTQAMDKAVTVRRPRSGVKRFILSAAQDGTELDHAFLDNLEAYAEYLGATIKVAKFTYGIRSDAEYHPRLDGYLSDRRLDIAGKLLFCAEVNTVPTAVNPLSGMETYTRSQWGIFPHTKMQLQSIPTMKGSPAKIIMTTGCVTKPNYIQRKAGIKAEFHHVIAAVLVEVDSDGDVFCRHLVADADGSFQDLDIFVSDGAVSTGHNVEAITWGDIHHEKIDPVVAQSCWGLEYNKLNLGTPATPYPQDDTVLDVLRPKYQFFHDIIDFKARNHHNSKDPHFRYRMFVDDTENVYHGIYAASVFLNYCERSFCTSVVVESNHDMALERWLREADYRSDPINAEYFLLLQAEKYRSIREKDDRWSPLEWTMKKMGEINDRIIFLREEDSYRICRDHGEGIECGIHGHLGANGAKPSPKSYTRMGPKANTAHTHSANIIDGIYTAGVSGSLEMGYNKGLSSWTHSHIITYSNGKRCIVTMAGPKWRA